MKKEIKQAIAQYQESCENLARCFQKKYFPLADFKDSWYVADDPTGIWFLGDYCFPVKDMYEYFLYDYSEQEMFEHWDYDLDMRMKGHATICIRDYKKLEK